ncbi:protein of unknown function DUF187 [Gemmatirosa kalamazoonensis]|uniref:Glycosyl hydrolase-like 10 domain-containing protein n=2 Tax=Gemmatirosa kalamazoonensis TaxID=861299 RepID=W0RHG0_9BACT|nr:protein of unknown function DUF187 [Gemmatirosa kalamazoonensis]
MLVVAAMGVGVGAAQWKPDRAASAAACGDPLPDEEVASLQLPPVTREMRAAWVSPVEGGEWPSRSDMSPDAQRAELLAVLDRAVALGLNAVVLHVRVAADAMYPTRRAPWSSYLTRARGEAASPGYDPLAFAVAEAHRRGLQLHAWFNPFRAAPPDGDYRPGATFLRREHPRWIVRYGSQTWIDPGYPDARRNVLDAILEVVDRYDIDAVHLDDYFYPYQETETIRHRVGRGKRRHTVVTHRTIEFPDATSWARYGRDKYDTRGAFRRANVSDFIASLYRGVKERKPWVLVGISPFGIWRPGNPPGLSGLDAYTEIFADSRQWLREGWLDYLAPQLYWQLDGEERRFTRLDAWWRGENVAGRHIWPGLFTMRVESRGSPWPAAEIPAEIAWLRQARAGTPESLGHFHFRLAAMAPDGPLGQRLRDTYAEPALPPASPWLGAAAPSAPVLAGCASDAAAEPPEPAPASGLRVTKDAAAPRSRGEMAPTPRTLVAGPAVRVHADTGAAPVRWWVLQLRDAAGRWSTTTLPGDLTLLPVLLPNGERARAAAVVPVSPTGVTGRPAVVRVE